MHSNNFEKFRKLYEMLDGMLKPGESSYHPGAFDSDQKGYSDPIPVPCQTAPLFLPCCIPDPKENFPNFPIDFVTSKQNSGISHNNYYWYNSGISHGLIAKYKKMMHIRDKILRQRQKSNDQSLKDLYKKFRN